MILAVVLLQSPEHWPDSLFPGIPFAFKFHVRPEGLFERRPGCPGKGVDFDRGNFEVELGFDGTMGG